MDHYIIITTTGVDEMANIHSRMPLIFTKKEQVDDWLSYKKWDSSIDKLLTPNGVYLE
jgi:putative SOS response-associated peptidase YedK